MNGRSIGHLANLCWFIALPAMAADAPGPEYAGQVAPVLKKYCAGCHNGSDREGEFSLETYAALQKGTPDGPALLPGDAAGSRMVRLMTGESDPQMPPDGEPRPSADEVALLKAWIDAGAKGPDGAEPDRMTLIVPHIEAKADVRPVAAMEASRDQKMIAVARYEEVTLYATQADGSAVGTDGNVTGLGEAVRTFKEFPGKVTAVHFSADGTKLVTASGVTGLGGVAAIWNVADGMLVREFKGHRDILYDAELSPDGKVLATSSYDKSIELWNAETGERLRTLSGHSGAVYDVAFSPDGRFLVSASADDTCKVWRVADGERMDTLGQPLKEAYCCAFTPDGRRIVASGADNNLRVWNFVSTDKPRINPMTIARFAHEGPIVRMAFTPDGAKLITAAEDRTVKVWDAADFTELQVFKDQPEVAAALAVGGKGLRVGRLDGSIQGYALDAAPQSGDEQPAETVAVVPMDDMAIKSQITEQEPNNSPADAATVMVPAEISGAINGPAGEQADRDLYRFAAKKGQEWVIEVNAARNGSKLDSFVEVLDADGSRIERVLLQAVRDSYFTFRGKDSATSNDFRVFNWEEMHLDEYLYSNGEVARLWLYPRGPDSGFMVYPGQGQRWGYFDTTPLAHALGEPCYVVRPYPPGTELVANGLPTFTLYYENDDDAHQELGKDSKLFFTAPADGEYLVQVKDVRGHQGPEFKYTLTIRPRQPDFAVTLHGANPVVSAGSGKEFKVTAKRLDGFEGPIRVELTGLPPGFTATSPVIIQEGQIEALGVITAAADAPAPTPENAKAAKVTATATIRGREVSHDVNELGEVKLGEQPKLLAEIVPADGGAQPVATPENGPLEFVIRPGETIMLKAKVTRNGHTGNVPFGNEGSGRNLPFGVYVDNVGLNGLLILENMDERTFYVTADASVPEQSRLFHLNTSVEGGQATRPVLLHVRREGTVAGK